MIDWLFRAFGDAIADVREKVVETGWYGRPLTDRGADRPAENSQDLGWLSWKHSEPLQPQPGQDHGREQGHGH